MIRGLIIAFLFVGTVHSADKPKNSDKIQSLKAKLSKAVQSLKKSEAIEMLFALAKGEMGPNQGWFKAGQSRYSWRWLTSQFDKNKDGRITRKEMKSKHFLRLDRDESGAITIDDFNWTFTSPYLQELMMAGGMLSKIDRGGNGAIDKKEWLQFFEKAAQGKKFLTPEDLRRMFADRPQPPPKKGKPRPRGPSFKTLFKGLVNGEIGSILEGPDVGKRAPHFTLKTLDNKPISLRNLRKEKPVILIFGSFT